ncbi:MAG TPA: serine/threonine-protein kinase [Kofleriaceae bacterium]|nr:serine/threonine-protein kinase [Kofleriaceae bacterium]
MTQPPQAKPLPQASASGKKKGRESTRMRFVAPPGMSVDDTGARTTIGRYEVIETLGKGAMGVVYKARDPLLDRVVAVKTIVAPRGVGRRVRSSYLERFEREAKAAAKMQHPSIVTIFDIGLEDGAPFMVLEYLPGESLADRLDRVRMPLGRGVQAALDLANALGFAHRERVVHRDVKPANVLHAGENRWKLADFGIARMPDSDLTQVGIFMGTPGYAPPEAIRQGQYSPQADVFAWGAVLYELLSGRIPYEGPDTQTTNSYVLKASAVSPRQHDPSIPEPLAEVTLRALDPSVDVRYRDAIEAEQALRRAWDLCLGSSLVAPSCLTAEEVPHERVGATMHAPHVGGAEVSDDDPTTVLFVDPDDQRMARTRQQSSMPGFSPTVVAPPPSAGPASGPPAPPRPAQVMSAEEGTDPAARIVASARRDRSRGGVAFELLAAKPRPLLWIGLAFAALFVIGLIAFFAQP